MLKIQNIFLEELFKILCSVTLRSVEKTCMKIIRSVSDSLMGTKLVFRATAGQHSEKFEKILGDVKYSE